jgi:KDO2-lipid IV(A) lauroyltransferase
MSSSDPSNLSEASSKSNPPNGTESYAGFVDRFWGFALACAVGAAEALGVERALRWGYALGVIWRRLHLPRVTRVRAQLAAAFPEKSESARAKIERDVFCHLGQGVAELLLMSGRHRPVLLDRMEVEGLEHLERASREAGGIGAVVIGPHLGNWELGAAKLAELGVPVSAVYRGLPHPALERAVLRVRGGPGATQSQAEGSIQQIPMGRRAGVQFIRALGAGRNILALLDQHAGSAEGILVPFFGRPASTRFAPLKLADRAGAPVLCAFARRDPDGRQHRLTFHPALQLEQGASGDEEVLRRNLQTVTALLEREIRRTPGQWIWTHRRWREPQRPVDSD